MKTTQEMIEVMQAFADGKAIEYKDADNEGDWWGDSHNPDWNWIEYDYRIKPVKKEPTYRPYESVEEMINDFKDRFSAEPNFAMPLIWVHDTGANATCLITAFTGKLVGIGCTYLDMRRLFEDYTYLDGSPCGKLVEE